MLAQMQFETAIESLIDKVGFPIAVVMIGALCGWRIVIWFAPLVKDWGNRIVESHERLVNSSISIGESNSQTLAKIEAVQGSQAAAVHRIETTLEALRTQQAAIHGQIQGGRRP
jgi:phosphatidylserine decarboxylase